MQTPIEKYNGIWVKRDDLYKHPSGAMGEKALVTDAILKSVKHMGYKGVVFGVARNSSVPIVAAKVTKYFGLKCYIHTASGKERPIEFVKAGRLGAMIFEHSPGYQSQVNTRAREMSEGFFDYNLLIPLGFEHKATVKALTRVARETVFPRGVKRLIVPVGNGITLCGIMNGIVQNETLYEDEIKIVGIRVGQDPTEKIKRWVKWEHWAVGPRDILNQMEESPTSFSKPSPIRCDLFPFVLDPYYEAKCVSFLKPGDCFWIGARRNSLYSKKERG